MVREGGPSTPFRERAVGWITVFMGWYQIFILLYFSTLCRVTTMGHEPRLSAQTLKVLNVLLSSPRDEMAGSEIGRTAKLATGTLYPILMRLEDAGWLTSRWETDDPKALGRPRKRFYRVTAVGARKARSAFSEFDPVFGRQSWA
jgi:DNA-binding PadR family transcriptional regulator